MQPDDASRFAEFRNSADTMALVTPAVTLPHAFTTYVFTAPRP